MAAVIGISPSVKSLVPEVIEALALAKQGDLNDKDVVDRAVIKLHAEVCGGVKAPIPKPATVTERFSGEPNWKTYAQNLLTRCAGDIQATRILIRRIASHKDSEAAALAALDELVGITPTEETEDAQ
jgi:hypothetical protein